MRLTHRAVAFVLMVFAATSVLPVAAQTASTDTAFDQSVLFKRMSLVNKGLRTYRARVHLDAAMSSFPFLHPTLDGSAYFKQPDKNAIIFDSVPAMASLFKSVFPRLAAPAEWPVFYHLSLLGDTNGVSTVRLIPRKEGRIQTLDVTIDDTSAVPTGYTFSYRDGGSIHFNQHVVQKDGFALVDSLDGLINLPSVKADAKASFTDYHVNVPVTDAEVNGTTS